jgi:hypothetical protein
VDNYLKTIGYKESFYRKLVFFTKRVLFNSNINVNFDDHSIVHLYQSNYAKIFLMNKNASNIKPLIDSISSTFLNVDFQSNFFDLKQNIVLYNPIKGIEFTKLIINNSKNITFVPLSLDLTSEKLVELLKIAKIYIDFGNHPGRDRFPREASFLYCVLITGTKGSANNEFDIRIDSKYKFTNDSMNLGDIYNLITDVFDNYTYHINNQKRNRLEVMNDIKNFKFQLKEIWQHILSKYS